MFAQTVKTVYNWSWKANICVDVDFDSIYLKKNNLIEKKSNLLFKNIFVYPVYGCSHYGSIVSNSLLLLDGKVKCLKNMLS